MEALQEENEWYAKYKYELSKTHPDADIISDIYWSIRDAKLDCMRCDDWPYLQRVANRITQKLIPITEAVKEFYALEIIALTVARDDNMHHSYVKWQTDFSAFYNAYVERLAAAIYDYTALVVAGEMRHAKRRAEYCLCDCDFFCKSRAETMIAFKKYNPDSILNAGKTLFSEQVLWQNSYGGEKWRLIAEAGLMYNRFSPTVFVDRCVDLSHNNSVYFDKGARIMELKSVYSYDSFLDLKRTGDVSSVLKDIEYVGEGLRRLIVRAVNLNILNKTKYSTLMEHSTYMQEAEDSVLKRIPISWGADEIKCKLKTTHVQIIDGERCSPYGTRRRCCEEEAVL